MTICEKITQLHPVRKSAAQKEAFRQWVMGEISELGYTVQVEQNDKGHQRNIVAGDPENAAITIAAHYDTPSTVLLPDMQIPRNYPVYVLWHILVVGGMLLLSFLAGFGLGLLTGNGNVMLLGFFGVFLLLMLLQLNGFANRNNVNDNTSGVAALLETMALIPADRRDRVAFILFDNMEKGRRGSKAYARDHLEMQYTRFVISLDSVGVGEVMLVSAPTLAKQMAPYMALKKVMQPRNGLEPRFYSSMSTRGNGDFRSFKCGVGITAYEESAGIGLCLGDLHTARDTRADQNNIEYLAQTLSALAEQV